MIPFNCTEDGKILILMEMIKWVMSEGYMLKKGKALM